MKLLSVVIPLYREVGVCSITAREDLWEHSKEESETQSGALCSSLLSSSPDHAHPGLLCIPASCSLSLLRGQPSE